ncbi:heat shock protein DnaJ domain protein [Mucilaginibacter paludis DSM 18603]|uniref:Heat shock protein DnaJ domain protein n=1 Tax=Mucilaginibacter paludis DSM 18603 TaxID=714943 RepID=H1Y3K9_9SPHI|nr:heat shock protein DnaJ domain protein [Mucilaginibacter paludis DSM 18603]
MQWFHECRTLQEVKATYKKLARQHHPDLGGDTAVMQEINREYAFATARIMNGAGLSEEETEHEILSSEAYRQAIENIAHLLGVTIEIVGHWIWVTGNTYPVRDVLKKAGFFFASKKQAWYFRTAEYKTARSSGKSLDAIRSKYGSETIRDENLKRKSGNRLGR